MHSLGTGALLLAGPPPPPCHHPHAPTTQPPNHLHGQPPTDTRISLLLPCVCVCSKIEAQTRQVLSGKDINDIYDGSQEAVSGAGRGWGALWVFLFLLLEGAFTGGGGPCRH